jgi:hypothetical protein
LTSWARRIDRVDQTRTPEGLGTSTRTNRSVLYSVFKKREPEARTSQTTPWSWRCVLRLKPVGFREAKPYFTCSQPGCQGLSWKALRRPGSEALRAAPGYPVGGTGVTVAGASPQCEVGTRRAVWAPRTAQEAGRRDQPATTRW